MSVELIEEYEFSNNILKVVIVGSDELPDPPEGYERKDGWHDMCLSVPISDGEVFKSYGFVNCVLVIEISTSGEMFCSHLLPCREGITESLSECVHPGSTLIEIGNPLGGHYIGRDDNKIIRFDVPITCKEFCCWVRNNNGIPEICIFSPVFPQGDTESRRKSMHRSIPLTLNPYLTKFV